MAEMTAEQLSELILDLYSAKAEAKEYLDFFVSPDIDKKLDKAKTAITKEVYRQSRGRNRSRPTRIRRMIKDLASLDPGAEHVAELMVYAIEVLCTVGADQLMKPASNSAYCKMLNDAVIYVDSAGYARVFIPRLEKAIADLKSLPRINNEFKSAMTEQLLTSLDALSVKIR